MSFTDKIKAVCQLCVYVCVYIVIYLNYLKLSNEVQLLRKPGCVVPCVGNLTEGKSCVSVLAFPTGI
jgi:hypothetical protein